MAGLGGGGVGLGGERVDGSEAGEAGEIAVIRCEGGTVVDSNRRELGVGDQVAFGLPIDDGFAPQFPEIVRGLEQYQAWHVQPAFDDVARFDGREVAARKFCIGAYAEEGCDRLPWHANDGAPRQEVFEPRF